MAVVFRRLHDHLGAGGALSASKCLLSECRNGLRAREPRFAHFGTRGPGNPHLRSLATYSLSSQVAGHSCRSQRLSTKTSMTETPKSWRQAFVAVGSNIGDRLAYLEDACRRLNETGTIRVKRTSGLWETKPMYVENQAIFLNGAIEIVTSLEPLPLLDVLQRIEKEIGREKLIDKGPRSIDLDILLYDDITFEHPRLSIPHKLMHERGFVLQPLCELIPDNVSPNTGETFRKHLRELSNDQLAPTTSVALAPGMPTISPLLSQRSTLIMSVLNVTPDSFSDGGMYSSNDVEHLRKVVHAQVEAGAKIIDIGGQSTRPHAAPVSSEEEIARVVPSIKLVTQVISDLGKEGQVAISVDTYRSDVAEAAVHAGAHIINDVSAGTLDSHMLDTMASLGCTVILMHMRGDPSTMASKACTTYPDGQLLETIGAELAERVAAAERAGVRRWRMILDPGVGFAKTGAQNLEILRSFSNLRSFPGLENIPWLVGTSRKGFIGKITGTADAKRRTWGTAAAVTAAIQGGADIVRVHDVDEMRQVALMADAIWRL